MPRRPGAPALIVLGLSGPEEFRGTFLGAFFRVNQAANADGTALAGQSRRLFRRKEVLETQLTTKENRPMTCDEAKQFIFTRTGEPPDIIQRFLERRFRYKELNGVAEPTDDIAEERQQHHDILLLDGGEAPYMVVEYVRRTTDLEVRRIANILAEEMGYMESRGMVDCGVYACYRGWADDVIQTEDAGTKAQTHQLRLVKS